MTIENLRKTEAELVEAILGGERNLYGSLVDKYAPIVFHVVRRFEKDEDEVQELAQQIFVKVFEKLASFKKESSFSSWLYSLASNHCRDYVKDIRRQNLRMSELEPDYAEQHLSHERTPEFMLQTKEYRKMINSALSTLTKDYSEPFLMKYRDGLSYEIMTKQTGVSVSALKVRVHRARKELYNFLKKKV
jgi:RNA polymerase sigma-70 factor, ECF subfamily